MMVALISDPMLEEKLIAERRAAGTDKYDEVWEGVYVMAPMANNEHQGLAGDLTAILKDVVEWPGHGKAFPGVNVSDRAVDWTDNYRCPDVAAFLTGTAAKDCDSFWLGGPDFAVEITSPGDRTREKLDFYAKVATQELLIVDRDPWKLTLFRLQQSQLNVVGESSPGGEAIVSHVVPLSFRLVAGAPSPEIEVSNTAGDAKWTLRPDATE